MSVMQPTMEGLGDYPAVPASFDWEFDQSDAMTHRRVPGPADVRGMTDSSVGVG
jgi:hypothetical protein